MAVHEGFKITRVDGTTRGGYRWPLPMPGERVTVRAPHPDPTNEGPCPSLPGDGLCVALSAAEASFGGVSLSHSIGLWLEYDDEHVLTHPLRVSDKLRVSEVTVTGIFDPLAMIRWGFCGDLRRASLRGADLQEANLWGAYLWGADLQGAYLWGANLQGANLQGAYLQRANLQEASMWGANLQVASMWGANLWGANLEGANLEGANLEGANLQEANLLGANLQGANLRGADLRRADLQGADLRRAKLQGARGLDQ